ncbi:MAG: hypothetical protein ACYTGR_05885 [Planctomycetota bacterium]
MSSRPMRLAYVLIALALCVPAALADETVSPADPTIVLDVGKSESIKVNSDPCNNLSISAMVTGGGGNVTVSPAAVNGKTNAQFKVSSAKNGGATTATVTVTVNSDCGTSTYVYEVFVVMKAQVAEKGLKMATKAAEKAYKNSAKAALATAKTSYANQLAATEAALDALELSAPEAGDFAMYTIQQRRAEIMRAAVLQGLIIHMVLNNALVNDHFQFGVNPILVVFFSYLVNYSNPLVAPLAYMSGANTLWFVFLVSMHSIATQSSLTGVNLLQGYFAALAKLSLARGLPFPFLFLAHGYGVSTRYLQGASEPAPLLPGPGDGGGVADGIPLQISAVIAWNNPLAGPDADAGVDHGSIGVAGMAGPENGDVTISLTALADTDSDFGVPLQMTVPAATLSANGGTFAVVFDGLSMLPGPDDTVTDFGSLAPGQYYVEISQEDEVGFLSSGAASVRRYIDLPRMTAQAAK